MALTEQISSWVGEALHSSLLTEEARDYLMGRGATPEIIESLGIKVFDCPRTPCPNQALHSYYGTHFQRFEGKIVFPLYNGRGKLLGFDSRSVDKKDSDNFLFPENQWNPVWVGMPNAMLPVWEGRDVIIVEGVFDLFAMRHVAKGRAVLASRSAKLTWHHLEFLKRWCAIIDTSSQHPTQGGTVLLVYDRDAPGERGTASAMKQLFHRGVSCKKVRYGRAGDDPGLIWDRGGVDALLEAFPQL